MITIIIGTRPEIIKMAPIMRECERRKEDFFILHTGQHYTYDMDRVFFKDLHLPEPRFHLDVGSGSHGEQTGTMLSGIEKVLLAEHPDMVLVQGDTNTVLAGVLATAKLHLPVGHVEAGLRSYDRRMAEEINRIVADHVADSLFAPTELSRANLVREGIPEEKIFVTGNTIVDAVTENLKRLNEHCSPADILGVKKNRYFLVTAHRSENVDAQERLEAIIHGLREIHTHYQLPVLFPMHPRTVKMVHRFGILTEGITILKPFGYFDFLHMEANAHLVLTDSGGVQEEACILQVPCVTLRDNTERPETISAGSNVLVGTSPENILQGVEVMLGRERTWTNPFGDGHAGQRIVSICKTMMG